MRKPLKFIDLSVCNRRIASIQEEIDKTPHSFGYLDFVDDDIDISVIRFGAKAGRTGNHFMFNRFFSFRFFKLLSAENAIVLFHGFSYPLHFLILRNLFPRHRWIVQHHAGNPSPSALKRAVSKLAYSRADAYLFVSKAQAEPFIEAGIIPSTTMVWEIMECSTGFIPKDKADSRAQLAIDTSQTTFIWVGNLTENKDPMCALKAFKMLADSGADFTLYMFYNATDLLAEVSGFIDRNQLHTHIILKGKIENRQLETWFSATDYFVSCSHSEGSGIALAEAMACGCVPIVTSIPSFVAMTSDGNAGMLFEPGNSDELFNRLKKAIGGAGSRVKSQEIFKERLSFEAIGKRISQLAKSLHEK